MPLYWVDGPSPLQRVETAEIESAASASKPNVKGGWWQRWPETCWRVTGPVRRCLSRLDGKESLLRTRSYRMSWLDIAMAGGVVLLVALIVLRKKAR
jgi:hypothetical protein